MSNLILSHEPITELPKHHFHIDLRLKHFLALSILNKVDLFIMNGQRQRIYIEWKKRADCGGNLMKSLLVLKFFLILIFISFVFDFYIFSSLFFALLKVQFLAYIFLFFKKTVWY